MEKQKEQVISKYLSFILRHSPSNIDLNLTHDGWANIEDLIKKSKLHQNLNFTKEELNFVVLNNNKQRFLLSKDMLQIKANQGHSIQIDLGLLDIEPPNYLYHGTAIRFLDRILKEGLKPMSRHAVHLSLSYEIAESVGIRHGKPIVIRIKAKEMHLENFKFQCTANNVWLTKIIEPKYFKLDF